ncbi:MAG TPA: sugar ABC transporter substrate-binding protein [Chloroflexota bacterium]|nr:sugar ABC transporter substrate-binding protein [Chloroflexota bacterium]
MEPSIEPSTPASPINKPAQSPALSRRTLIRSTALTLTGTALLAACGGEQRPAAESVSSTSAPVTFQYWDWAAVWKDLVGQLADGFTAKQRNVTVQWEVATDYWTKLQVAIAGDTAPDSWRMNGPNLPSWTTLGLLEDINTYIAKDKDATASLKAMAPVIADYTKRDGKQWTMPFGQAISGIIAYNEDLIKAEGLTPPAELGAKWTWAVLQEYAIKLTRRDGSRHGYFVNGSNEVDWLPFVNGNGGAMFDKEGKRAAINTLETREALEYLSDLSTKHQVTPTAQDIAQENAVNRFLNGRLAMLNQGSWEIKDLNLKAKDVKWDLVPVPAAPRTKKGGGTNQMASIAMAKGTKHKDTVWQWQKFIGSKDGQDVIARAEFFPARLDSAEQIYYKPELGPKNRPLLREVLKVVQPLPWLNVAGNTGGWGPIADGLVRQMFAGTLGTKDGLQQMHEQLDAAIQRGFK